ncbi:MAG: response regulator transcription factor [Polyangiales bacterium]
MSPEICLLTVDSALGEELEEAFSQENVRVASARSGAAAARRAKCGCSEAVVIDEEPPDMTAASFLRQLRSTERGQGCLVVMLSSRTSEIDRVIAFELGADDFVPKPIGVRELALRLNAVLRRHHDARSRHEPLHVGPFVIDPRSESVTCGGESLRLTSVEFRLLEHLARNAGRVQDRRALLERVWRWCDEGPERAGGSRTVDTHVKRLREKLGGESRFIETIRGVGYRLRDAS